jgi:hypothetical protein
MALSGSRPRYSTGLEAPLGVSRPAVLQPPGCRRPRPGASAVADAGGTAGLRLSRLIESLAARLGTRPFPPHVTLLPAIEGRDAGAALSNARSLAPRLRPLTVRLASVEGRDEHFRCLIAVAVADEPLRDAHAAAARAFGREPDPAFLPRQPFYGSLAPDTKRALASETAHVAGSSSRRHSCTSGGRRARSGTGARSAPSLGGEAGP